MDGVRPRAVTLDEVARRSGVSRATASRALNGRERVNPEVRARVQMIADGLGYRPNVAARSLASGRVGVLGLVIPTGHLDRSPYEALLLEAVADAATGSGRGVMLWLAQSAPAPALRDGFRAGLVDGVVISEVALSTSSWVEDLFDGPASRACSSAITRPVVTSCRWRSATRPGRAPRSTTCSTRALAGWR